MRTYTTKRDTGVGGYVVSGTNPVVLDTGLSVAIDAVVGDLILFGSGGALTDLVSGTPTRILAADAVNWRKMNYGTYMIAKQTGIGGVIATVEDNGGDNYTAVLDTTDVVSFDSPTVEPESGDLVLFGLENNSDLIGGTAGIVKADDLATWNAGLGQPSGEPPAPIITFEKITATGGFVNADLTPASGVMEFASATAISMTDEDVDTGVGGSWTGSDSYGLDLGEKRAFQTIYGYTSHSKATPLYDDWWSSSDLFDVFVSDDNVTYQLLCTVRRPYIPTPTAYHLDFRIVLDEEVSYRYVKVNPQTTSNVAVSGGAAIVKMTEMSVWDGVPDAADPEAEGTVLEARNGLIKTSDSTPLTSVAAVNAKAHDQDLDTAIGTYWSNNTSYGFEFINPTSLNGIACYGKPSSAGSYVGWNHTGDSFEVYYANEYNDWTLLETFDHTAPIDQTDDKWNFILTFAAAQSARYWKVRQITGANLAVNGGSALIYMTEFAGVASGE